MVSTRKSNKDTPTKEKKENNDYIPYMCLDEKNNPSKDCLGCWFYHLSDNTPEYNANFAKNKNWNLFLLSLNIGSKRSIENKIIILKFYKNVDKLFINIDQM